MLRTTRSCGMSPPKLNQQITRPGAAVQRDQLSQLRERVHVRGDEHRVARPARPLRRLRAVGGDPNRWVRLLDRSGREGEVVRPEEPAPETEPLLRPGLPNVV